MPEMNGFEMARIIHQNDKRVIIFFLTDRTDKVDRLYGFKLKGNDYIPKPFYPEELIAKINERFECSRKSQRNNLSKARPSTRKWSISLAKPFSAPTSRR